MRKNMINEFEQQFLRNNAPDFKPGDTVVVSIEITDGNKVRQQDFEGVVIARRSRGFNSSFTVRKISYGEGVERVFPLNSPIIKNIVIKRRGDVRKAKLYYLRDREGKSARIKEKLVNKTANNQ